MRPQEELPGRSPIAPGQARITLEFLRDGLSEKKLQLIGTSILLILLSPEPGCYSGGHERALAPLLVLLLAGTVGGAFAGVLVLLCLALEAVEDRSDRLLARGMAGGDAKELLGGL